MDNVRKYLPHSICLLFLTNLLLVFALKASHFVLVFGVLTVLFGIGVVIEIFNFLIKLHDEEVNVNKPKTSALIILLSIFYIPCFNLKYIEVDEDYKKKNLIYLIISIVLSILAIFFIVRASVVDSPLPVEYKSYTGDISFRMPDGYVQTEEIDSDYTFYKNDFVTKITTVSGDYDINKYTEERVLVVTDNSVNTEIKSNTTKNKGKYTIRKIVIEGVYFDEKYTYVVTTIVSSDKPNKIVNVFQYCNTDNYKKYEKNIDRIIESIEIN